MSIIGRLNQYGSMLANEFNEYSMSENLIIGSEFDHIQQSGNTTATANQLFVPYGRLTAVNFVNNGGAGNTYVYQNFNTSFTIGTQYVISIFSNTSTISFDQGGLAVGKYTILNSGSISLANNWWRHWVLYSATVDNPNLTPQVTIFPGNNITLSGWQLELGSSVTNYTPTTTTAISRSLPSTTNTNITGVGIYYSAGFDENSNSTSTLAANVFEPYNIIYDEIGGTLVGPGQGRYMRQNGDKSVIVYNEIDEVTDFRNIVRDGLILDLDAGMALSYPGYGTTWTDLSGNGNHATLVNGPTYSSTYRGSFLLDATNDEIILNGINWNTLGSTRNFTFMFGAKKIAYGTGGNNTGDSYLFQGASNGFNNGWRIIESTTGTPGTSFTGAQSYIFGSPSISTSCSVTDTIADRFGICAFTQNGVNAFGFLNQITTTSTFGSYASGGNTGFIGRASDGVGRFNGYVSFILVYNRALTQSEIEQNYTALKNRFGL